MTRLSYPFMKFLCLTIIISLVPNNCVQIIGGNFTYLSYHETSIKEHQAIVKVLLLEQMGGK